SSKGFQGWNTPQHTPCSAMKHGQKKPARLHQHFLPTMQWKAGQRSIKPSSKKNHIKNEYHLP
ncbi:hypothetical protein, partial [Salmonella sp. s60131]|uniref:hypothetical protein n=1 Tax=Salmonella sp. s60131 TaxID=3159722 RepID=UPI0039809419